MKKYYDADASAYYAAQRQIMQELKDITDRRTTRNGKQIAEQIADLQRRAYPEFYQTEQEQPETVQADQMQPKPIRAEQTEPQLNAMQLIIGFYYYFARPIRRARMRCKARK